MNIASIADLGPLPFQYTVMVVSPSRFQRRWNETLHHGEVKFLEKIEEFPADYRMIVSKIAVRNNIGTPTIFAVLKDDLGRLFVWFGWGQEAKP